MTHHNRHSHKGDLTKGPVTSHLIRLAVPMTWGIMAVVSFQLVDMFYISLLGTQALAAITFTLPVTFTVFNLVMGMTIAASSVISREIGKGNPARVRRLTTHALLIAIIIGLVAAAAGLAFMKPVFRAMGADEHMIPLISDYMTIWFIGSVFINTPMVGNATMRAAGDAFTPAIIMTIAAVANAVLDPVMIFGMFGVPRMEMQGAALATVISNICAMAAGAYVIGVRKKMLSRSRRHLRLLGDSARRFLFIAIPVGITGAIQPAVNAVLISLLSVYGHAAVAAFGIASRVEAFAFVVIMGVAVGMAPIVGQNFGARQYERVNEVLNRAILFAVGWSVFVAALLGVFARPVAGLFSAEADVIRSTAQYFLIVPFSYAFGNLIQGWCSAFNAMGFPKRSLTMIVIRLVVINIPLAYVGAHLYGVAGVFGAITATNVIAGTAFHVASRSFCRRTMKAI